MKAEVAPLARKLSPLIWVGYRFNLTAKLLRNESNLAYVSGVKPFACNVGMTNAGPDSRAGVNWKACCSAAYGDCQDALAKLDSF